MITILAAGLGACGPAPDPVGSVAIDPAAIALPHGGWERVELSWRMTAPLADLDGELRVSLHLKDGAGRIVRTFDHPFPGDWAAGGEASYPVELLQSALAPPLDLGELELVIGLYDGAGHRWAVDTTLGDSRVATVRAVEPGPGFPETSFSAEWLPVEGGQDLQILVRRWLEAAGAIRVRGIDGPGSLWLRVGIPRAGGTQEMVLTDGAVQPAIRIAADCSGFEAELAGEGSYTAEIPLTPDGEIAGECRLRFSPNFELVSTVNSEKRTIALENLAWRRAP